MNNKQNHSASFRDPSGYVYLDDGVIKRHINPIYFNQYKSLNEQGIFEKLIRAELLIKHKEVSQNDNEIVLQPEQIPFITYPYEWSFNQYKEAALLTLKIQKFSLDHGFSLKDASAFNVAFYKGKAIFIDTLSFDFYRENLPWRAFKQFITHFLGPLVLAHYHGAQALKLMNNFIDGIPVGIISSMLPFKTKLNPFLYSNIHLLAKYENKHNEDYQGKIKTITLSKKGQLNIINSLYDYIKKLSIKEHSEWGDYYNKTNYSISAFSQKSNLIDTWIKKLKTETLIDIGGNDGTFVRRIKYPIKQALVCDIDYNAVDLNYKNLKIGKETYMLPFIQDILNPTAAIGFNNKERQSFLERIQAFKPDVTLALAIIHHMTLSGNIPFDMSADFFASFSKYLIIEFPKRDDSWVQRLLSSKGEFQNHFKFYTIENFRKDYVNYFETIDEICIDNSERVLFLLRRKNDV
ncbi:class I SAM-dependent methyltransferase [Mariniflexile aquimaris]|uniref:Class I SAM-dependent methyltransferase n=1 Tax=Mariniflexile aquimaris TaxID=881009 RepID=A0ABW3BUV7_9FLAO